MKKYNLYGFVIESDIEFVQLVPTDADVFCDDDVITIKSDSIIDEVDKGLEKEEHNYRIGFDISYLRNSWGYYVVKNGRDIFYELKENASIDNVKPFLLGYCMAMALLQRKILAIHCSAVCYPIESDKDGALLIVGESGAGKSTITRKLIDDGFGFMADDMAAISLDSGIKVLPAFPYQKLCRNEVEAGNMDLTDLIYIDEDKDKFLVPAQDDFVDVPQKVRGMICIVPAEAETVDVFKLSGIDQFMVFKNNVFICKLKGKWENDKEFLNLCMMAAGKCPVYVITRPIGKNTVMSMVEKIKGI